MVIMDMGHKFSSLKEGLETVGCRTDIDLLQHFNCLDPLNALVATVKIEMIHETDFNEFYHFIYHIYHLYELPHGG